MAEEKAKQKFKPNIWMISTIVLAIVVVSLIVLGGFLNSGTVVGEKTIKYINET